MNEDNIHCNVFSKGNSPGLFYNVLDGSMKVVVGELSAPSTQVISNARVNDHKWNHVAVVVEKEKVLLYINGILDAVNATSGAVPVKA